MPKAVVLDSNALMMPFQFKVNLDKELTRLFGDVPVFVPSSVLEELAAVRDKHAKPALQLARKYQIIETELRGDDAVLDVARRRDAAVVTNDRDLIRRVRELRLPVVRLRGERFLIADEF